VKVYKFYDIPCKIKNELVSSIVYKINKVLLNVLYPIFIKPEYGVDDKSDIIVSLTSFPDRIDTVWMTVMSLLHQTIKPRKIILWLAEEQFPEKEDDIPPSLLKLKEYGLSICFCEDLKPHKKYYYSMLEYPEYKIITVDDDVLYPEFLIEELNNTERKYPGRVCCTRAHRILLDSEGHIMSYKNWEKGIIENCEDNLFIIPIGCGGVLYPPNSLDERLFEKSSIKELCLLTDDLWLKSMSLLKNTRVVKTNRTTRTFMTILKTQSQGLHYTNNGCDNNDVSMKNIINKYPEIENILSNRKDEIFYDM
jgi:hypothetical protein